MTDPALAPEAEPDFQTRILWAQLYSYAALLRMSPRYRDNPEAGGLALAEYAKRRGVRWNAEAPPSMWRPSPLADARRPVESEDDGA